MTTTLNVDAIFFSNILKSADQESIESKVTTNKTQYNIITDTKFMINFFAQTVDQN